MMSSYLGIPTASQLVVDYNMPDLLYLIARSHGQGFSDHGFFWRRPSYSKLTLERATVTACFIPIADLPLEHRAGEEAGVGKVSEGRVEGGPWGSPEDQNWPFRGLGKHLALQTPLTIACSGGQGYIIDGVESP
jgi:hypothetical protein